MKPSNVDSAQSLVSDLCCGVASCHTLGCAWMADTTPTSSQKFGNLMLPAGMRCFFGQDNTFNNADVRIKASDGSVLKVVPVCALLLASYSSRFATELINWQPSADVAAAAVSSLASASSSAPRQKRQKVQAAEMQVKANHTAESQQAQATGMLQLLRPSVCVSVENEDDVEGVEHCLRFMYTGTLPQLPVPDLHSIHRQADYMGVMECCSACVAALCAFKPQDISIADAVSMGYAEVMPEHLRTEQVKELCLSALLHHLGDVVVVMRSEELKAQWCEVPHAALVDLLRSEQLATDSEDSVVAAVSVWGDKNDASMQQQCQLFECLRLLQTSAAFFYRVLPRLKWRTPGALPAHHLLRLAQYANGDATAREDLQEDMPAAWMCDTRRPCTRANGAAGTIATLTAKHITRAYLVNDLLPQLRAVAQEQQESEQEAHAAGLPVPASVSSSQTPSLFAHGCELELEMEVSSSGDLGMFLYAHYPMRASGKVPWRLKYSFAMSHVEHAGIDEFAPCDKGAYNGEGCGNPKLYLFPRDLPITDIASWEQLLLVDGAVHVAAVVDASVQSLDINLTKSACPRCLRAYSEGW